MEQKENLYQMFNHAAYVKEKDLYDKKKEKQNTDTNNLSVHEYLMKLENRS